MKEINFVNIGPLKTIKKTDIIGIFDLDTSTVDKATRDFLKNAEVNKKTESAGGDLPKSFVLTGNGKIYFSPYAARVLKSRCERNVKLIY